MANGQPALSCPLGRPADRGPHARRKPRAPRAATGSGMIVGTNFDYYHRPSNSYSIILALYPDSGNSCIIPTGAGRTGSNSAFNDKGLVYIMAAAPQKGPGNNGPGIKEDASAALWKTIKVMGTQPPENLANLWVEAENNYWKAVWWLDRALLEKASSEKAAAWGRAATNFAEVIAQAENIRELCWPHPTN